MRWFFDLLGPTMAYKADLTALLNAVQAPVVSHDASRAVMGQLQLTMLASSSVNPLQDLIRMRWQVRSPDGGWLEYTVGPFMFVPPTREIRVEGTWWTLTAPDLSQLLADAAFSQATTVKAGASYVAAVSRLVDHYGGTVPLAALITDPGITLPATLTWDAGTSVLKAVNDLLGAIAYTPAWADGLVVRSQPVPDYSKVPPVLTLDTTIGRTTLVGPLVETPDYSNAFNQVVVIGEDPRRQPFSTPVIENRDPDSPISIPNWHERLMPPIRDTSIPDLATATKRGRATLRQAAQVYATVAVTMPPFPLFGDRDVVQLVYSTPAEGTVNRRHLLQQWQHTCSEAQATTASLQRVVAAAAN